MPNISLNAIVAYEEQGSLNLRISPLRGRFDESWSLSPATSSSLPASGSIAVEPAVMCCIYHR